MPLRTHLLIAVGLLVLAAPAQATPHASSMPFDAVKPGDRGSDAIRVSLYDDAAGRSKLSFANGNEKKEGFYPPGLSKKYDGLLSHSWKSDLALNGPGPRPVGPIPEPTAALLFGVGILLINAVRPGPRFPLAPAPNV